MNNFCWVLLNIGVPVLGPLFLLALVSPTYGWSVAKRMMYDAVKDGQLYWAAIALSASALYELFTGLDKLRAEVSAAAASAATHAHAAVAGSEAAVTAPPSDQMIFCVQVAIGVFFAIAFSGSVLVSLMGIKAYHDERERQAIAVALAGAGVAQATQPAPGAGAASPVPTAAPAPAAGAAAPAPAPAAGAATPTTGGPAPSPAPAGTAAPAPAVRWTTNLTVSFWLTLTASGLFAVMHLWIG